MEVLTLTTPQSVPTYSISQLSFDWLNSIIDVWVTDALGKTTFIRYKGIIAHDLMVALNKANLSTVSLQKRIFQQLTTDGKLPDGTVTGTPE